MLMARMIQKELKKPYFHFGPFWKGKYQEWVNDFTVKEFYRFYKYQKQTKINKQTKKQIK